MAFASAMTFGFTFSVVLENGTPIWMMSVRLPTRAASSAKRPLLSRNIAASPTPGTQRHANFRALFEF